MKTKIIFLALVLITGLGCYSQDNLTLRDEDLPYEISDSPDFSQSSQSSEYNEYPTDNVSSQSSESSTELPDVYDENQNSTMYTGKVYWIDTRNRVTYTYDTIVDRPNAKFFYYSRDGYNFTYYPASQPFIYDEWLSWRVYRYSSYYSFCHVFPYFHWRINYQCNSLSFYGNNYGRPVYLRDNYYGRRYANGSGGNRNNNNGGYNNTQGRPTTNERYRQQTPQPQVRTQQRPQSSRSNEKVYTQTPGTQQKRGQQQYQQHPQSQKFSERGNSTQPSGSSSRGYSNPSRSASPGYSTPARSSSPNYSTPSRSGNSGGSRSNNSGGYNHRKR